MTNKTRDMTSKPLSMVNETHRAFRALADPTRRQILVLLSKNEMTIGDVVNHFDITRAAIKKHLNILQEGTLISVHRQGREKINRLETTGLKAVSVWVNSFEKYWGHKLGSLHDAIEYEKLKDKK